MMQLKTTHFRMRLEAPMTNFILSRFVKHTKGRKKYSLSLQFQRFGGDRTGYGKKGPGKKGPGKKGPVKTVPVKTVLGKNGPKKGSDWL